MRIALSVIFLVLIVVLAVCAVISFQSRKAIGKTLGVFLLSLIPPVTGNLFLISSIYESLSIAGCYIYFIGMNLLMAAVIRFTFDYCGVKHTKYRQMVEIIFYSLLVLDSIQLLVNVWTGHAFGIEQTEAYNSVYYIFIPRVGQTIHRVLDYTILGGVLINFVIKSITTPKVYAEKYIVILLAMIAVAAWQTFYIVSRTPVDFSMTGFAVFGVLVFLLSLYYRPLRLLDRMLAAIASRMPEAIFFFDTNNKCIWVNHKALEMFEHENGIIPKVEEKLKDKIGDYTQEAYEWSKNIVSGSGEHVNSMAVEKHQVIDDRNRSVGYYISVRDNSVEQQNLQRETFNASHDPLTKILNRAGYDTAMEGIDLSKIFLLVIDFDSFKEINDQYGHNIGDLVLMKAANIIKKHFRESDYVCRIGGDEFTVILPNADENIVDVVREKIKLINAELVAPSDLPSVSISAGGAFGKDAEDPYELFNNADHALYEMKFSGKCGFKLFKRR